jgi:hypothetical protein
MPRVPLFSRFSREGGDFDFGVKHSSAIPQPRKHFPRILRQPFEMLP